MLTMPLKLFFIVIRNYTQISSHAINFWLEKKLLVITDFQTIGNIDPSSGQRVFLEVLVNLENKVGLTIN